MRRMCKSFVWILLKALCAIASNKAVSVACRRPSHFSLLAHAAAVAAANGEAGPKGGGQDALSQEKWPREMASFNTPSLRAGCVEGIGTTPAYAIHNAATPRRIWKPSLGACDLD